MLPPSQPDYSVGATEAPTTLSSRVHDPGPGNIEPKKCRAPHRLISAKAGQDYIYDAGMRPTQGATDSAGIGSTQK
ncbi:hypothetical protein PGT21_006553 [Puccinia graminis f. sp. tritici]|uniref:Uncharacterized protein n=1 Tax=Puccinia graminis f. sp. tritici TaxID=56615 RepID=A0A5B0RAV3_PUCGR|nr:hypothetical protein PGT21_006553 [Puccinia graminis f. sp. tritici]KAA1122876.1 hypothetical protein PGTUg99_007663 [Puccinia graminis f. sp. tritici]